MRWKTLIFFILATLVLSGSSCDAKVKEYKVKVVKEYPHDTGSYTQGLFFYKGDMYESTGQYGSSTFRYIIHLSDGAFLKFSITNGEDFINDKDFRL